jgi:hypothetical protein
MLERILRVVPTILLAFSAAAAGSCRSAYYGTMEAFGVHKREILVDRVEEGREAQKEAKEEFVSALEAFRAVADFEGGELEKVYERLSSRYEASAEQAKVVSDRIDSIEKVAGDLFDEWSDEIREIESADLRRKSQKLLDDTKRRCADLIDAMQAAEKRMKPVLTAFHDHVLFLKHNLNAQAVASLEGDLGEVEADVAALVRDMEASIREADAFLAEIDKGGG